MDYSDWVEVGSEVLGNEPETGQEAAEAAGQTLTPKVLDLMEKISEYGYLTMREVQLIYGNKTWAYKVVKGLRSQGFIADHDTLMSPRTAHYLTSKGYRILGKFGRLKVGIRFKPERYSIFIFRHRMACAKVGLLLEKHPLVREFLPESQLFKLRKNKSDKLCDGEFWYQIPGYDKADRVGLEVELTLKSGPRLDETFRELAAREDLEQVWWICADDNILRAMRREVRVRQASAQRHLFALLYAFIAAKGRAVLMEPDGALVSIDPEQPTLLLVQPEPPTSAPQAMEVLESEDDEDPLAPLKNEDYALPEVEAASPPWAQAEAPHPPQPAPRMIAFRLIWKLFECIFGAARFLGGFVLAMLTPKDEPEDYSRMRRGRGGRDPVPEVNVIMAIALIVTLYILAHRDAPRRHYSGGNLYSQGR